MHRPHCCPKYRGGLRALACSWRPTGKRIRAYISVADMASQLHALWGPRPDHRSLCGGMPCGGGAVSCWWLLVSTSPGGTMHQHSKRSFAPPRRERGGRGRGYHAVVALGPPLIITMEDRSFSSWPCMPAWKGPTFTSLVESSRETLLAQHPTSHRPPHCLEGPCLCTKHHGSRTSIP